MLHKLQEKSGRISDLSVTLDSVRAEVTTLMQQLEKLDTINNNSTVQGQEKSDTVLHLLQEKAGRISDLSVTLDSVRAEVTSITQQLEKLNTISKKSTLYCTGSGEE